MGEPVLEGCNKMCEQVSSWLDRMRGHEYKRSRCKYLKTLDEKSNVMNDTASAWPYQARSPILMSREMGKVRGKN